MENQVINKTGAEAVRWDLSRFYSGVDDPQINTDLDHLVNRMSLFNLKYKGNLVQMLGQAMADLIQIEMNAAKITFYLGLVSSVDVTNNLVKAKFAEMQRILNEAVGQYMEFFHVELVEIDGMILEGFYASDPLVLKHKPWIEQARLFKPHLLSEAVESALTKRAAFSDAAWSEFFDEMETDLVIEHRGEKKTLNEALHILETSKDHLERAAVLKLINEAFAGTFAKYSAQTLYVVAGFHGVDIKDRKYDDPMQSRNMSNKISNSVVATLHKAVNEVAGPLARRYYKLKAAHLGLKVLGWGDRNAPLMFSDVSTIQFSEARDLVLRAYASFSPTLEKLVKKFFDDQRVDAPAERVKQSGAFCSWVVMPNNQTEAFVFMNYLGSKNDVMTLAHELGHGVHGFLAGEAQGVLMNEAPIAYCETASIFGEMITFNFLKQKLLEEGNKQAVLGLLMEKIDGIINSVVRQISFSNFERRIHGMDAEYQTWNAPKKLSVEELDEIWLQVTKELYGEEGEVFTYENTSHLWAYIPHFHNPFYVYGYAFGELLVHSLYAEREALGERFEPLYLEMLASGGTKNAIELLLPFGLDPNSEDFWAKGIECSLGKMIAEAEELSKELGLV